MRKVKILKITVLFLIVLCAFSCLIINMRKDYLKNKQEEIKDTVVKALENQTEKVQKRKLLPDGAIGLIIIPSIEVEAPICEGTSSQVLKYTVRAF